MQVLTHFNWAPLHSVRLAHVASDLGPICIQTVFDALIFISISSIAFSHALSNLCSPPTDGQSKIMSSAYKKIDVHNVTDIATSITFYDFSYNVVNEDGKEVGRKHSTLSNTGSQLDEMGVIRTPSNTGFRYTKSQNK